ncbi:MAG: undecaprenyl/decaprenyl-phosphate alpha-N-acetylglucosaminyl 1-phosphate transferase, partial [Gemmatimonadetes bacterium]|nr:undecaprenyl/decaprenyl-phosphate alpha-N-acetylglucosaminyl 1-phosphate transferase [Gemmatimonadota bacterium]
MRSLIDFALLLAPFAAAFVLTALLTPLVRGAAVAAGRVSPARDDRWHTRPTPILGGVAIFVGFGITVVAAVLLNPEAMDPLRFAHRGILPWSPWEGLLAAGTTVFLVGLADDFVGLRPMRKLAGQLVAASILVMSGIGVWLTGIFVVDAVLSVFWFVAITNALNLLDSMDGVAAGVALIAAIFLSVLFLMDFQVGLAYISLAFAGALLGFLIYNYPPAKIFMGDSGSLFIGLFLAGLALSPAAGASRSLLAIVVIPVLVLAIPILDTTLVTVSRVLERRPISEGGRDHASHRLVSLGVSETRALWILWVLAAVGGGVGLLVRTAGRTYAALLGGLLLAFLAVLGL